MDALIENFLSDTKAVQPVRNPAFNPVAYHPEEEGKQKPRKKGATSTKADDSDPALKGWKMRGGKAIVKDGIVSVRGTGDPFLGVSAGVAGPAKVSFRVRSGNGGAGKAEWIPAGGKAQSVPFTIRAGDWQTITLDIPATGPLGIFRIHLPAQTEPVEIDHIELVGAGKPRRWDF
jgi:hypothetical protein